MRLAAEPPRHAPTEAGIAVYRKVLPNTPVGPLVLTSGPDALLSIQFSDDRDVPQFPDRKNDVAEVARDAAEILKAAAEQLSEYFSGRRREFSLPLRPAGTEFQRAVWQQLELIPYGRTISYGALAAALGNPQASRAVGAANGRNPLPIVIPCHRVIGASGSLTGFGGGLERKKTLLNLESDATGGCLFS